MLIIEWIELNDEIIELYNYNSYTNLEYISFKNCTNVLIETYRHFMNIYKPVSVFEDYFKKKKFIFLIKKKWFCLPIKIYYYCSK